MALLKYINLALAFLLELCMLVALGYWGFSSGQSWLSQFGLGLGAPILVAVIWGIFLSPRATVPLASPLKFSLEVIVFGCAVVALVAAHQPNWAWAFALVVLLNKIMLYFLPSVDLPPAP
ncbi:MAG: YrdB family protein [Chloroflexi bacterium]|nr:YrdB family protein [Chloroflexota bacterium]